MKTPKRDKTKRSPAPTAPKKSAAKKPTAKKAAAAGSRRAAAKAAAKKSAAKKKVAAGPRLTSTPKATAKKPAAKKKVAAGPRRAAAKATAKKPAAKKKVAAGPRRAAAKATAKKPAAKKKVAAGPRRAAAPKATPKRRPKTFAAAEAVRAYGFPDGAPELPETYGEDRLVLMVKDPEYLFAYWEITPGRLAESERAKKAGAEYREALRLNWDSTGLFDANYALLPVSFAARRWYLRAPYPGKAYRIELGWLGSQGHFISLLESNKSDAPESWAATRLRLKRSGLAPGSVLERTLEVARPLGSSFAPDSPQA